MGMISHDGAGVRALTRALTASGVGLDQFELLRDLQCIHDGSEPSAWTGRLRLLAEENDLSDAVLPQPL